MKRSGTLLAALCLCLLMASAAWGQSPVPMASTSTYTEDFSTISTWANGFTSPTEATRFGSVAVNATGAIPDGKKTTTSTATFASGTSGGVQKGTQSLVLLSTGTTDNTSSTAVDLFLDFTGVNAGTLSFDWATVNNSTGDRKGSMRVYTSTDGTTFTELTSAAVLNFTNNSLTSGSIVNVQLPTSFNNSATARIRFYYYNGTGGATGSRPKLSLDNLKVTAASAGPATEPTLQASNVTFTNVTASSLTMSWTNGNGSSRLVLAKQDGVVDGAPTDGTAYTANTAFGSGTQIGAGNFVIFAGTGNSVNVTNLSPSTAYNFAVFEFNGSGTSTNYLTTSPATGSQTTSAAYTISGTVRNGAGVPMAGVALSLESGETPIANAVTDASGNYSFPGVSAGGNYTVTPSAVGFTFSPASRSFDALAANQTADFTALPRVIISELRFRGPGVPATPTVGAQASLKYTIKSSSKSLNKSSPSISRLSGKTVTATLAVTDANSTDEFVELYNRTDQPVNLAGFSIVSSGGTVLATITSGTIAAYGHYLIGGTGYSLGSSATPDRVITAGLDIPDGAGVALFNNSSSFTMGTRLDAAGFSGTDSLYMEGAGLSPAGGVLTNGEHSFVRLLNTGTPQDTDNNSTDFLLVATDAGTYGGIQSVLGAPGPENTTSPINHGGDIKSSLIDRCVASSLPPNRERDLATDPAHNSTSGTLAVRRAFTNNTGQNVTKLRFRVVDLTTAPAPSSAFADLRLRSSTDHSVTISGACGGGTVGIQGLTLEEPPTQAIGGGINSTVAAGYITLNAPLSAGASTNVEFLMGVQQPGNFRFFVMVEASAPVPASSSEHLVMGNPSNAVVDVNQPNNYLLDKPQYAVGYSRDLGRPNWVSWHLSSTWLGSAARQNDFRADTTLPAGWYQVQGTDYSGSGFDRGHHTPSADRTSTVADNSATFLMTNMMPQAPDNNQGPWEQLESYCRTLISQGNELYIIAGGTGSGGTGSNGGVTTTLASGHVAVPAQTWKVIIVIPEGSGDDAARVTTSTRTIAVIMPNAQGIRTNAWQNYRVSVDQVEALTGFDFFSNVPVSIQNVIEARVDNQ
ncbi:MAG: endonuclease mitochondrial [Acidobacteriota bacterium]|nr:endonuclease mitochondrial [Acidobacteriota bacterium]